MHNQWPFGRHFTRKAIHATRPNKIETLGSYELGSRNDPFVIYSPQQWNVIGYSKELMNKSFMLGADLNFVGIDFRPIGASFSPFTGQFRGNNYAIKNIILDESAGSDLNFDLSVTSALIDTNFDGTGDAAENSLNEPLGIFRVLGSVASFEGAKIEDQDEVNHTGKWLYLIDNDFTANNTSTSSVGTLAGLMQDAGTNGNDAIRLNKVSVVRGYIRASGTNPAGLGGVIGQALVNNQNTELRKIESSASLSSCNIQATGGIIGSLLQPSSSIPADTVRMQDLRFYGDIDCSTEATDYVGGIVGMSNSIAFEFETLFNSGNIIGDIFVGGLFGVLNSTAMAGKSEGDVNGTDQVGGLVGQLNGSVMASYTDDNYVDATTGNAGAITGFCNSCILQNNLANTYGVTAGTTASYFMVGTPSTVSNNLYTGPTDETISGANYVLENQLYDYATSNILSSGLADSPWTQPPGTFPMLHFERWPEFLVD